jgi:hypothetical protein
MSGLWNDFNDAQGNSNLIPKGTLARVRLTIRPGGFDDPSQGWTGGYATRGSTGAVYLNGAFTVTEGQYARRKIFTLIGLYSPKVRTGRTWAAARSATLATDPSDHPGEFAVRLQFRREVVDQLGRLVRAKKAHDIGFRERIHIGRPDRLERAVGSCLLQFGQGAQHRVALAEANHLSPALCPQLEPVGLERNGTVHVLQRLAEVAGELGFLGIELERGTQVRQNRLGSGQFLGVEPGPINGLGWLSPGIRVVTLMLA